MATAIRPTKKQRELLNFIAVFIAEHGYSPSYREIMHGAGYNSVATVAEHVNNLIRRGHLVKREHSARSLEVVHVEEQVPKTTSNVIKESEEKWLVEKIEHYFKSAEQTKTNKETDLDHLYVLIGALRVLGLEGAAQSFIPRLSALKSSIGKK
jgi:SOS-response transcriptional repressor LexA